MECFAAKTKSDRYDSKNVWGRSARIFANKENRPTEVKIDNIVRVDLDGDGEEEVLISATNYFSKDDRVPMRSPAGSYSMVLLRRVVSGKVETQLVEAEFHPKAYVRKEDSFDAPNAYKVITGPGSGWRRQHGNRGRLELLRRRSDHHLLLRYKKGSGFTLCGLRRVTALGFSSCIFAG